MERYKILEELGSGAGGSVYRALDTERSEIVAVKKMKRKFSYWWECANLREMKSLLELKHPNIIKLLEIVHENNELFFIFECMEHNLYQIMQLRKTCISEDEIRDLMSQVLQGLAHVHKHGYFHRDLKPENLLVTRNTIKIADFGLARELSSTSPFTEYVTTRWYRAPEVLLRSSSYTPAIDMWSIGAILAELFLLHPLFPGETEIDQLFKICRVIGVPPDWNVFPEATNFSGLINISFLEITLVSDISNIISNASLEAIDLIKQLCSWDPLMRPTAEQCLRHPFFNVIQIPRSLGDSLQLSLGCEPNLELKLCNFGTVSDDDLSLTLCPPNLGLAHKIQSTKEDIKSCSDLYDHPQQSVFSSLFPSDHNILSQSALTSLSLSLSFSTVPHPQIGVPQSAGCSIGSFQSSILSHPLMETPSPFQPGFALGCSTRFYNS